MGQTPNYYPKLRHQFFAKHHEHHEQPDKARSHDPP